MRRYFTHYWNRATWVEEQAHGDEGQTLGKFYGNQFTRHHIGSGDLVYALTVLDRDIFLHCRVEVERVDLEGDPEDRWREAVVVRPGTSTPRHFANRVPSDVTRRLTFITAEGVKSLVLGDDGKVDPRMFRQMRELTAESATLLDQVIDQYEPSSTTAQVDLDEERLLARSGVDESTWVFQFNPQEYDLEAQLTAREFFEDWRAVQHRGEMRVGERVYFLRSGGSTRAALVAAGRIVSSAYKCADLGEGRYPYRVDVLYEFRIQPELTREEMRHDEILSSYRPFATGHYNTNFMLPQQVAARTEDRIEDRLHRLSPDVEEDTQHKHVSIDSTLDMRTRTLASVVRRQGQPEFRRRLLAAYDGRCAVSGCNASPVLEAAHIAPYLGPHTNHPTNGLLLRADIHTLFDLGLLAIDTSVMVVKLALELQSSTYAPLDGVRLRMPCNPAFAPNMEALDRHRQWAGI